MTKMQHSWYTASSDVKKLIVQAADPGTARSLCQLDDQSKELCRTRLQAPDKYRICLDGANGAAECDGMSMFSQQQFLSAVPVNIEIFTEDPVQLTHQFYSQNYKLPNEGYAIALRKAKLMNTLCAVLRPEFLLTDQAKLLPIPPYVDTTLLDIVSREYAKVVADESQTALLILKVVLKTNDLKWKIEIGVIYEKRMTDILKGPYQVNLRLDRTPPDDETKFVKQILADDFMVEYIKDLIRPAALRTFRHVLSVLDPNSPTLNVFQLSRLLKIAFDLGYYHDPDFTIDTVVEPMLSFKL